MAVRPAAAAFTARGIAITVHCLRQARRVRRLAAAQDWLAGPDIEAGLLRRSPGPERRLLPWLRLPPVRRAVLTALDLRVPGTARHLLARKLWFHHEASAFLRATPQGQLLILGAGLDGLGSRLAAAFPAATVLECDRPATMALKQAVLGDAGPVRFLPRDLARESGLDALDPDRPTLLVAEGLLMYLSARRARRLLVEAARSLRAPTRLLFSYLDTGTLADPTSPVARLRRALDRRRQPEPLRWSTSAATLPDLLATAGFTLEETFDSQTLADRTLADRTLADRTLADRTLADRTLGSRDPGDRHPARGYGEFVARARRT